MRSAIAGSDTPTTWRRTPAGLASGPRKLNVVGTPSSVRAGPANRIAGWNSGAKQNPMPASSMQRATPVGSEVDDDAELLEHVGRAARRRRGPVAVLGDPHARARDDERRHRRDVDGAGAVAARAAGVDDVPAGTVQRDVDGLGEPQHRADQRGQLGRRLALGAQRDGEAGDLGVGRLAGEDRGHRLLDELGRQVLAAEQAAEHVGPERRWESSSRSVRASESVPPQVAVEHAPCDEPELHLGRALDDRELLGVAVVQLGAGGPPCSRRRRASAAPRPRPSPPARWRSTSPSRGTGTHSLVNCRGRPSTRRGT